MKDKMARQIETVSDLQADLEFKNDQMEKLQRSNQDKIRNLEEIITDQQMEVTDVEKAKLVLEEKVTTLQIRLTDTNENNHHLLTDLRKKSSQIELKEKEIENVKATLEKAKGEKLKVDQGEEYVVNLQDTLKIVQDESDGKSTQLLEAAATIKDLQDNLMLNETTQDEISELEKQVQELRQQKEETEQREVRFQVEN